MRTKDIVIDTHSHTLRTEILRTNIGIEPETRIEPTLGQLCINGNLIWESKMREKRARNIHFNANVCIWLKEKRQLGAINGETVIYGWMATTTTTTKNDIERFMGAPIATNKCLMNICNKTKEENEHEIIYIRIAFHPVFFARVTKPTVRAFKITLFAILFVRLRFCRLLFVANVFLSLFFFVVLCRIHFIMIFHLLPPSSDSVNLFIESGGWMGIVTRGGLAGNLKPHHWHGDAFKL